VQGAVSRSSLPLQLLTIALGIGCALGLAHVACVIGFRVPFDPNEGWNAYFAQAALATGSPYPPAHSMMINNYPPLSFYLIGAVSRLSGDAIIAGRIVSLAALVAVALAIEAAARQMGCGRGEALFAALLFTAGLMLTSDYAGMDDPQLLGHAIAVGGLVLALQEPRTPRLMVGAALLFVVAFFVKHNLVVLPAALAAWLMLADRRHAVVFMASGVIFLLVGLGIFKSAFGISMLDQINSARTYSLTNIGAGLRQWLPWSAVPLAGAAGLFVVGRRDKHAVFCVIYAAIATAAGLYFLGGAGVDANAMFDADIALALAAGVLMNRLEGRALQGAAAALFAVGPLIGLINLDDDWRSTGFWLHPMAEDRATAAGEIALIRAAQGPVLCEMLSLCYWAGKPAEVDVFNIGQAFETGARSDAELARSIAERRYALLQFEGLTPFPLTPRIRRAVAQNYRIIRKDDDRVILAPR
jgi:hypothetical protein